MGGAFDSCMFRAISGKSCIVAPEVVDMNGVKR